MSIADVERHAPAEPFSRTVVLGIDSEGVIHQCGQNTRGVLGRNAAEVIGRSLVDLVEPGHGPVLKSLLDAIEAGRERTALLTIINGDDTCDTVVTVQPFCTAAPEVTGLMLLRIAPPEEERFVDPAFTRQALLGDGLTRLAATLDPDVTARGVLNLVVPAFANSAGLSVLEALVGEDEPDSSEEEGTPFMRRMAVADDEPRPEVLAVFPIGEVLSYPEGSVYAECLKTRRPVLVTNMQQSVASRLARLWRRKPVADVLTDTSLLTLPLIVQDEVIGLLMCTRYPGYRAFDAYDVELGQEFAARVAKFIDNACRYNLERATAITLQRALLPPALSAPVSVQVDHRYLPGSKQIEVGGDWYEAMELPGSRVALTVGDVAGHGVRAAVTMGSLRTALHTLARLELPPGEALERLDDLMTEIGEREPHFATCVHAVYDARSGTLDVASAGHLPPLLVRPDGSTEFLPVLPAPPLGVGTSGIVVRSFQIEDGSLLVLYTDGLVESRGRDIDDGLERLRSVFGPETVGQDVFDLCPLALGGVYGDEHRDDIALLIARLGRVPGSDQVSWALESETAAVPKARRLIRGKLDEWDLEDVVPVAELVVSELVTNALRHGAAPIVLRMVKQRGITLEVADGASALPRVRTPDEADEGGRGLQVVARLSSAWGTRRSGTGKIVWCELAI